MFKFNLTQRLKIAKIAHWRRGTYGKSRDRHSYYIYNYYENGSILRNGKIFLSVIDSISKELNVPLNLNFTNPKLDDYNQDVFKGVYAINKLVFQEPYQAFVLTLLEGKQYYMKIFIIELIKLLGNAKDQIEVEKIIDDYLKLPFIHNVKFNGIDKYSIQTDYGDYSFTLADRVLNDADLIKYINSKEGIRNCHGNVTTLLNHYDDLYSICSLCHNYFVGYYYHSYDYMKETDEVFDICSNMFIKKSAFDDLFAPREVLFMRNEEVRKMYYDEIKNIKSKLDNEGILKCALYSQSLELNNNPKEKMRILEFNGG